MSKRARWEWGIIAGKTAHGGEREGEPFAVSSPFSVKLGMHPSRALSLSFCSLSPDSLSSLWHNGRRRSAPSVLPSLVVSAQVSALLSVFQS